jgi:hypothetical protein
MAGGIPMVCPFQTIPVHPDLILIVDSFLLDEIAPDQSVGRVLPKKKIIVCSPASYDAWWNFES